eukprot:gene9683-6780_t
MNILLATYAIDMMRRNTSADARTPSLLEWSQPRLSHARPSAACAAHSVLHVYSVVFHFVVFSCTRAEGTGHKMYHLGCLEASHPTGRSGRWCTRRDGVVHWKPSHHRQPNFLSFRITFHPTLLSMISLITTLLLRRCSSVKGRMLFRTVQQ